MSTTTETTTTQAQVSLQVDNPFPGLRPFNFEETHLFFGREGQSDEVLDKLANNRFIAILGASGSGKSSLMYCGAIPTLYGGFMAGAGSKWRVVATRPGIAPVENLAEALVKKDPVVEGLSREERLIRKTIYSTVLRSTSLGLIEAIQQSHLEPGENVFILVDQFEELFRFKRSEEGAGSVNESIAFVKLLLEAVKQKDVPIYIALTMRSDFIGDCAQFPELTKFINDSHYLIPQMTREQKRLAVVGPVAVGGGAISPRLVQQLLNDVGDQPDQLPIMQHALMRTWEYWKDNREGTENVDVRHYESIGGMEQALSQHANEAYDELNEEQKEICQGIFKTLTEKSTDNVGIRRPTRLGDIAAILQRDEESLKEVIDVFRRKGRSLLMPAPHVALNSDTVVDISHESLMRIWARLRKWVDEEAESVDMYMRLCEASENYQLGKASLWRPPDLHLALNWKDKQNPSLDWAQRYHPAYERAMVFLETSRRAYEEEQAIKERLQKKRLRQARITAIVLGTAAVISLGFLIFAIHEKGIADQQRLFAEEKRVEAEAAKKEADIAKIAAEEARDAAKESERKAKASEREALHQKEIAENQRLLAEASAEEAKRQTEIARRNEIRAKEQEKLAIENMKIADEQRKLAEAASEEALRRRMLSIAQSMAVKSQQLADTTQRALVAQHAYMIHKEYNGLKHHPDIYNGLYYALKALRGDKYNRLIAHKDAIRSLHFGKNGKDFYTAGSDGKLYEWDYANQRRDPDLISEVNGVYRSMDVSGDGGTWLAAAIDGHGIEVINLNSKEKKIIDVHKGNYVWDVVFSTTSELVSTGADSTLMLTNINTKESQQIDKFNSRVRSINATNDGKYILVGTDKGEVILYDRKAGNKRQVVYQKEGTPVTAVGFSNDNKFFAFGDETGLVHLWSLDAKEPVQTLSGQRARINAIEFSHNDKFLASASFDGKVNVWELDELDNQPVVLSDHDTWVLTIAFSEDDNYLVTGCVDDLVRIWPTNVEFMADQVCSRIKRNMTEKEWRRFVAKDIPYEKTCNDIND